MTSEPRPLKPMPLLLALLYFAVPAFVLVLSVYGLIPFCLAISYVAQKRKNTWPGIITHFIFNGSGLIPLAIVILN